VSQVSTSGSILQVSISVHVHAIAHVSISPVHTVSQVLISLHVSTFAGSLGDVAETVNVAQVLVSELDSAQDKYLSALSNVI
jgi:hypothetical protein